MLPIGLIYCATNKVNGKKYIGMTTRRLEDRKYGHKREAKGKRFNNKIQRAIRKYGWENFEWKVLEDGINTEDLGKKEVGYIERYNTYYDGYNSNKGGYGNSTGETSSMAKYSDKQVEAAIEDVINTNMTLREISEKHGIGRETMRSIHRQSFRLDSWKGRKNPRLKENPTEKWVYMSDEEIKEVIGEIKKEELSLTAIANKLGLEVHKVSHINTGLVGKHLWEDFERDSRKGGVDHKLSLNYGVGRLIDIEDVEGIIRDYVNTDMKVGDIGVKYGIDIKVVWGITSKRNYRYVWDKLGLEIPDTRRRIDSSVTTGEQANRIISLMEKGYTRSDIVCEEGITSNSLVKLLKGEYLKDYFKGDNLKVEKFKEEISTKNKVVRTYKELSNEERDKLYREYTQEIKLKGQSEFCRERKLAESVLKHLVKRRKLTVEGG